MCISIKILVKTILDTPLFYYYPFLRRFAAKIVLISYLRVHERQLDWESK